MLLMVDGGSAVVCGLVGGDWKVLGLGGGCIVDGGSVGGGLLLMVDQWVVVLLMVDWWVVIGKFWVVVLLMVWLIWVWEVDVLFGVWDEFLCWVCLGFGISFCARGIGFSLR